MTSKDNPQKILHHGMVGRRRWVCSDIDRIGVHNYILHGYIRYMRQQLHGYIYTWIHTYKDVPLHRMD